MFPSVMVVAALVLGQPDFGRPPWVDAAMRDPNELPKAGPLEWTTRAQGFQTAEQEVLVDGKVVDRLHLVRLAQGRFSFEVMHDPAAPTIEQWRDNTGALAVINSSFYAEETNEPETPVRIAGTRRGPARYTSRHGAFVMGARRADVVDLRGKSVDEVIGAVPNAVVSYPLLFDRSRTIRASGNPLWLANRTFVGVDADDHVILGTTETGYFALRRLARFLEADKALRLQTALNLDGGPPACQSIAIGGFTKTVWGRYEANDSAGRFVMFWGAAPIEWRLPAVIGVFER